MPRVVPSVLEGMVTVDGHPIPAGTVQFLPPQGSKAPDTWEGVRFTRDEIADYTRDHDIQLLALEGAGTPAITIPMPVGSSLPLGLQLTAEHGQDARLLQTALKLERLLNDGHVM